MKQGGRNKSGSEGEKKKESGQGQGRTGGKKDENKLKEKL